MKQLILLAILTTSVGCTSASKKVEAPVIKDMPREIVEVIPPKPSQEEMTTKLTQVNELRFNAACWYIDSVPQVMEYYENFSFGYISDESMGILLKDETPKIIPPSCFSEATEKTIKVPYTTQVVDFSCTLDSAIVSGTSYNVIQKMSEEIIWLVDLKTGQNIIMPTNLCSFIQNPLSK